MGEVGIERNLFLYDLQFWEIQAIIDGYRKREHTYLIMTRWATYMQMCAGMADLHKAGIENPEDLLRFPWEQEEQAPPIPAEEQQRIREELQELNRKNLSC